MVQVSRNKSKLGWAIFARFCICLHEKDRPLLVAIQSYFKGAGAISEVNNNLIQYNVSAIGDIINVIIPHLEKYPLLTQKRSDFLGAPKFLCVFWSFCGTQKRTKTTHKNYALLTQSVARVLIPPTEESKLDFLLRRKSTFIFVENKSPRFLFLQRRNKNLSFAQLLAVFYSSNGGIKN